MYFMSAMNDVRYLEVPAPPPLDRLVHCFWFLRGRTDGLPQTVVPDGHAEIVLHLAEPFAQRQPDGVSRRQATALVSGQLTGPLHLAPSTEADVVGIRFRTDAARTVLHVPLDELTDAVLPLRDVAARLAPALERAVRSHDEPAARVRALAAVLEGVDRAPPAPEVRVAAHALESAVPPDLHRLARSLGVTTRTLERRCRTEIGLTPATLRRLARFRRAFRRLDRTVRGGWAAVAAQTGYFDQAHMIREFRRFAGSPPSLFFQHDPDLSRAFIGE